MFDKRYILLRIAADNPHFNYSVMYHTMVWCCVFGYQVNTLGMSAEISCLCDIYITFFTAKNASWCMCQAIPSILSKQSAKHHFLICGYHWNSQCSDCQNADFVSFHSILCPKHDTTDITWLHMVWYCDMQHLACQHCQHNIQYSKPRKSKFRHFRLANVAKQQSAPHDDI